MSKYYIRKSKKGEKSKFRIFISEKFIFFILLPTFYLMKPQTNFEKIAIWKIWQLVSFWGAKIHFGKLAMKWGMKKTDIN